MSHKSGRYPLFYLLGAFPKNTHATEKWTLYIQNWDMILNQLQVYFDERMDAYL